MIYSDGFSEATDQSGREYRADRLRNLINRQRPVNASAVLAACRNDLNEFRQHVPKTDDVTLFVMSRG